MHAEGSQPLPGQVDGVTTSTCSISGGISSGTLHARGQECLPDHVDNVTSSTCHMSISALHTSGTKLQSDHGHVITSSS